MSAIIVCVTERLAGALNMCRRRVVRRHDYQRVELLAFLVEHPNSSQ